MVLAQHENAATRRLRLRQRVAVIVEKSARYIAFRLCTLRLFALMFRVASHAIGGGIELCAGPFLAREHVVGGIDQGLGLRVPASLLTLRRLVIVQGGKQ